LTLTATYGCELKTKKATTAPIVAEALLPDTKPEPANNTVKIDLLLDTSNSMDGLINQAKAQLWDIVQQ